MTDVNDEEVFMTESYHVAVFIGRFQPFHIGHLFVFEQALKQADQLIVLVGSSGSARTLRNPFTFAERQAMMQAALPADLRERVIIKPLQDFTYDDAAWVNAVTETVNKTLLALPSHHAEQSVALVGHDKDETTYYLKLFPDWAYIEVTNLDGINATAVRQRYFSSELPAQFDSDIVPPQTLAWLQVFGGTETFTALAHECQAIQSFKSAWADTPYPVIFTTTDALVRYADEILLIRRKHYPGKNLFALPGGFVEQDEPLLVGCIRELREETHINVDKTTLPNILLGHKVFDNPKCSARGRVITHCYYFDMSHLPEKPTVQAADDAAAVAWVHLADIERAQLFEDHFFIIQSLLKEFTP